MKEYVTYSDMGSIKIFSEGLSTFFANGVGDGSNRVTIRLKQGKPFVHPEGEFLGHFTVKTQAHLSLYDCADESIHTFMPGRYFVYLQAPYTFLIEPKDQNLNA